MLWANLDAVPDSTVALLAPRRRTPPVVVEGEAVLAIGSPMDQRKVMTTGIISAVESRAIISDVTIKHDNSGGPLFNSLGEVIGITTFVDPANASRPATSRVIRIEEAERLIQQARSRMSRVTRLSGRLLPVDPADVFPIEAIKEVATAEKFDFTPYVFGLGDFQLVAMTPALKYRMRAEAERETAKAKNSANKSPSSVQVTFALFDEFRGWKEYVGEYRPVLQIRAIPYVLAQTDLRLRTDFRRMRMFCGDREIEPIHQGKIARIMNNNNVPASPKGSTYEGFYSYPADAISPACGHVKLEIYSEKNPDRPEMTILPDVTVARIAADFSPYLRTR